MKNRFKKLKDKTKNFFIKFKNKDTSLFVIALCVLLLSTALIWRYTSNDKEQNIAEKETEDNVGANLDPYEDYVGGVGGVVDANQEEKLDLYSMNAPLAGEVVKEFVMNDLLYYEAIGEWRVHNGVDIKPKDTLMIESAFAGKVESVKTSDLAGIEIIIDHGNNIKTLYSNLSSANVKIGDVVEKGQEIGNVGKVYSIEAADGPHLHFELIVEGENVNPLDYIPGE